MPALASSPYLSDLSADEWAILAPLRPSPKPGGRPRTVDLRTILYGIFHVLRSGCQWRLLPREYGPWSRVYASWRAWRRDGTWERIHQTLREQRRRRVGRHPTPSAAIIDSPSVKTSERGGPHGDDGAKQLSGRKRHLFVDTLGLVVQALVPAADFQDRMGPRWLLLPLPTALQRLEVIRADAADAGPLQTWVGQTCGWRLQIVARPGERGQWRRADQELSPRLPGFQPLPHRWIVERTFARIGCHRRMSKDYECLTTTSEAWISLSMVRLMLKRLAQEPVEPAFHYRRVA